METRDLVPHLISATRDGRLKWKPISPISGQSFSVRFSNYAVELGPESAYLATGGTPMRLRLTIRNLQGEVVGTFEETNLAFLPRFDSTSPTNDNNLGELYELARNSGADLKSALTEIITELSTKTSKSR